MTLYFESQFPVEQRLSMHDPCTLATRCGTADLMHCSYVGCLGRTRLAQTVPDSAEQTW